MSKITHLSGYKNKKEEKTNEKQKCDEQNPCGCTHTHTRILVELF